MTGYSLTEPTWSDGFTSESWITPDYSQGTASWPPSASGSAGANNYAQSWSRGIFFQGWENQAQQVSEPQNNEAQAYCPSQTTIGPDGLTLTAVRVQNGEPSNCIGATWSSGLACLNPRLGMATGTFAACCRFPRAKGIWPAFWFLDVNLSDWREIDLPEVVIDPNDPNENGNVHIGVTGTQGGNGTGGWAGSLAENFDPTQWHVYALRMDGENVYLAVDGTIQATYHNLPSEFGTAMFSALFNVAVGGSGSWPGEPDASDNGPHVANVRWYAQYAGTDWPVMPAPGYTIGDAAGGYTVVGEGVLPPNGSVVITQNGDGNMDYSLTISGYQTVSGTLTPTAGAATVPFAITGNGTANGNDEPILAVTVDGNAVAGSPFTVTTPFIANGGVQTLALGDFDPTVAHTVEITQTNDANAFYMWQYVVNGTASAVPDGNNPPQTHGNGNTASFTIPANS